MTSRNPDDPLGNLRPDDNVDLDDLRVGAHTIYGSISNIDFAKTTPEVFWSIFGRPNAKPGAVRWLDSAIEKLTAIRRGMPQ